jgi:hypothetical protein
MNHNADARTPAGGDQDYSNPSNPKKFVYTNPAPVASVWCLELFWSPEAGASSSSHLRQGEEKCRAFAHFARGPHFTIVALDDMFDNGKSQSRAALFA